MALSDERQQVLRMVEEGKISADEGAKLLTALGGGEQPSGDRPEPPIETFGDDGVHVHITVTRGNGKTVKLSLPLQVARVALPLFDLPHAALLGEHGVDVNRIRQALQSGEPGDVLDYQDEESGHRVHIVIG